MIVAQIVTGTTCFIKSTIGVPCPGCGLTRAYLALFRFQWYEAFFYHPLFWYIPLFVLVWIGKWRRYGSENPRWFTRLAITSLTLLLAVFAIRIVLLFPHNEPLDFNGDTFVLRLVGMLF
jgi:hypothetical protein